MSNQNHCKVSLDTVPFYTSVSILPTEKNEISAIASIKLDYFVVRPLLLTFEKAVLNRTCDRLPFSVVFADLTCSQASRETCTMGC